MENINFSVVETVVGGAPYSIVTAKNAGTEQRLLALLDNRYGVLSYIGDHLQNLRVSQAALNLIETEKLYTHDVNEAVEDVRARYGNKPTTYAAGENSKLN